MAYYAPCSVSRRLSPLIPGTSHGNISDSSASPCPDRCFAAFFRDTRSTRVCPAASLLPTSHIFADALRDSTGCSSRRNYVVRVWAGRSCPYTPPCKNGPPSYRSSGANLHQRRDPRQSAGTQCARISHNRARSKTRGTDTRIGGAAQETAPRRPPRHTNIRQEQRDRTQTSRAL